MRVSIKKKTIDNQPSKYSRKCMCPEMRSELRTSTILTEVVTKECFLF